jgi:hypothetical protein
VEVYLTLYKSYISGQRDHLSVAAISMPCDRKGNGYSLVREEDWKLKAKRGALCWGELLTHHLTN